MKAVRIHQYGHADVLQYEEAPMPEIEADDILLKIEATSINPIDWKIREGYLQAYLKYSLPVILGLDASGTVEAVGANVTKFKVGDEVYTRPQIARNGTYAQFIAVRANEVAFKPKTISHAEAASIPLVGITAWEALVTIAQIAAGQKVLIHAASGGVGSLAVQMAKAKGAYVIGTCSTKNIALVKSLGADEVIDYRNQNFSEVVSDVDIVLDTIGGETQAQSWKVLKRGGWLVSITSAPSEELAKEHGVRIANPFITPNAAYLTEFAKLIDGGQIKPVVGHEFKLAEIRAAHELSQSGHAQGKIVLHVEH